MTLASIAVGQINVCQRMPSGKKLLEELMAANIHGGRKYQLKNMQTLASETIGGKAIALSPRLEAMRWTSAPMEFMTWQEMLKNG